ncbi:PP2C family protein-serine/threonine phosphatase [Micromonospora sp. NPDC000089]|uniref:PP2C family protein-serine/threonine phosphatase n=1 Tax=unclassified Micromonospora TaxID=2617518 RepID=UPI0036C6BBB3
MSSTISTRPSPTAHPQMCAVPCPVPPPPDVLLDVIPPSYFQVAAGSFPAGGAILSGDFVDVFPTGDDRWVAVLGDVCGKGSAAAAVADGVRAMIRCAAARDDRPAQILSRLNGLLMRDGLATTRFLTVVCLLLRPAVRGVEITLCSAGHPPVLLRHHDSRVDPVGGGGTMLGVISEPQLAASRVLLGAGDTLLLYTDGVTEARRGDEEYAGRLPHLLARVGGSDVTTVPGHIQRAVLAFGGGTNRDDLAVLAVRGGPVAAVGACRPSAAG